MFKYVHHVHYVVRNLDEMLAYLEKTFEIKPYRTLVRQVYGKKAFFRVGQTELQVTEPLDDPELIAFLKEKGPGVHHVAWGVQDIRKIAHQLRDKGVKMRIREQDEDGGIVHYAPHEAHRTINMDQEAALGIYHLQLAEDVPE